MTDTEVAYLAGLFDGEGSIGFYKKRNTYETSATIANTDFRVLLWIQNRLPYGYVRRKAWGGRRLSWEFCVKSRHRVKEFLALIRPYLIIKAEQADLLLSLLDAEQEIPRGRGVKLSEQVIAKRLEVELELKRLKTAETYSIH